MIWINRFALEDLELEDGDDWFLGNYQVLPKLSAPAGTTLQRACKGHGPCVECRVEIGLGDHYLRGPNGWKRHHRCPNLILHQHQHLMTMSVRAQRSFAAFRNFNRAVDRLVLAFAAVTKEIVETNKLIQEDAPLTLQEASELTDYILNGFRRADET